MRSIDYSVVPQTLGHGEICAFAFHASENAGKFFANEIKTLIESDSYLNGVLFLMPFELRRV